MRTKKIFNALKHFHSTQKIQIEKLKWSLKEENTLAKLKKSNNILKEMVDLLPEGSISQIKAKLVQMGFSSKKIDKTHEIDSKEIKKQKSMYF